MSDSDSSDPYSYSIPSATSLPWSHTIDSTNSNTHLDDLGLTEHRLPLLEDDLLDLLDTDDVAAPEDGWNNFKCCGIELRDMHELVVHFEGHFMSGGADLNKLAEMAVERGVTVAVLGRRLAKRTGTGDSMDLSDSNIARGPLTAMTSVPAMPAASLERPAETYSSAFKNTMSRTERPIPSGVSMSMVTPSNPSTGHNSPIHTPTMTTPILTSVDAAAQEAWLQIRHRSGSNLSASPTDQSSMSSRTTGPSFSPSGDEYQQPDLDELDDLANVEAVEEADQDDDSFQWVCRYPNCGKRYPNAGGLKYHRTAMHPNASLQKIPEGFLGRNGKRGKNVPDIYKPYKCPVIQCGKRYKNLNGLKYHVEHHHQAVKEDPSAFSVPRIIDKEGVSKWDLSSCYEPLAFDEADGIVGLVKRTSVKKTSQQSYSGGKRPHIQTGNISPTIPSLPTSGSASSIASVFKALGMTTPPLPQVQYPYQLPTDVQAQIQAMYSSGQVARNAQTLLASVDGKPVLVTAPTMEFPGNVNNQSDS